MKKKVADIVQDEIYSLDLLGRGFFSLAYKAEGKKGLYVVRENEGGANGFEHTGDVRRSFEISHEMYENAFEENKVKSHGIFVHEEKIFHVQDFVDAKKFDDIGDLDEKKIVLIAKKIANIHKKGRSLLKDIALEKRDALYKRSIREVIVNHETLFSLYERWQPKPVNFSLEGLIQRMMDLYFRMVGENVRSVFTTCLHGDFWHGNMLFSSEDVYLIDFSRIPYGEPGIDIGWFIGNLEIAEVTRKEKRFGEYKQLFLQEYKKITGDDDIESHIGIASLRALFVNLSPLVQGFLQWDEKKQKEVYDHFMNLYI